MYSRYCAVMVEIGISLISICCLRMRSSKRSSGTSYRPRWTFKEDDTVFHDITVAGITSRDAGPGSPVSFPQSNKERAPHSNHQRMRHHAGADALSLGKSTAIKAAGYRRGECESPVWEVPETQMHRPEYHRRAGQRYRRAAGPLRQPLLQHAAKEEFFR